MTTSQWLGIGGLALIFAVGFWALWRGSNNRQDKNPDNWQSFTDPPPDHR